MRAVTWQGTRKLRVDSVPEPEIVQQDDVIVKVTATAICGSDLHLYNHYVTTMQQGDVLGHEFMGEVVEVGRNVRRLEVGDRVVVPFPIACGRCWYCRHRDLQLLRQLQPERRASRGPLRRVAGGDLRLLAHVRRVFGRPGGIRAGAVRRRRADQGAGRRG